jgi:hypothetical protein
VIPQFESAFTLLAALFDALYPVGAPLWTAGFQPAFFAILEMHAKVSPLRLILLAPNAGWKPAVQRGAPS